MARLSRREEFSVDNCVKCICRELLLNPSGILQECHGLVRRVERSPIARFCVARFEVTGQMGDFGREGDIRGDRQPREVLP